MIIPTGGNRWDQLGVPNIVVPGAPPTNMYNFSFAANDKVYAALPGYNQLWQYDPATTLWSLIKSNFFSFNPMAGGNDYYKYAFTNGSNIYFVNPGTKKLKQYNLLTASWTDMANFPGTAIASITATFTATKGYVLSGISGSDGNGYGYAVVENWEYDFAANTWTSKANTPGLSRYNAASLAWGDKIYFGTGISVLLVFNPSTFQIYRIPVTDADWYEYNTTTNTWTKKADFGGGVRQDTRGFVINGTVYLGFGTAGYYTDIRTDLYSYNPASNTWAARSSYPPGNGYPPYITMVGAATSGYAITEDITAFWRYTAPYNLF